MNRLLSTLGIASLIIMSSPALAQAKWLTVTDLQGNRLFVNSDNVAYMQASGQQQNSYTALFMTSGSGGQAAVITVKETPEAIMDMAD